MVEGHLALLAEAAGGAFRASPDSVETLLDRIDRLLVIGDDAYLEVASALPFCAKTRTRPVGASEVNDSSIDDDRLEMHTRAHSHLDPSIDESGKRVKALPKRTRRHRGVKDPNVHATLRKLGENAEYRSIVATPASAPPRDGIGILDHELLEVGRRDPNAVLCLQDRLRHALVVIAIEEKFERSCSHCARIVKRPPST